MIVYLSDFIGNHEILISPIKTQVREIWKLILGYPEPKKRICAYSYFVNIMKYDLYFSAP